ncbi:MAG: hypothetical protein ABI564_02640 [Ideonella sp.]
MPSTRRNSWVLALTGMLLCGQAMADGTGLRTFANDALWSRWQTRLLASPSFSLWQHAVTAQDASRQSQESISLLGDFYFSRPLQTNRAAEGFRATSGVIIGPLGSHVLSAFGSSAASRGLGVGASIARAGLFDTRTPTTSLDTTPYLGFGYSSSSRSTGWGFSADIGIVARNAGWGAQFGRTSSGPQPVDDLLRDMRLSPLMNIGVSYSF